LRLATLCLLITSLGGMPLGHQAAVRATFRRGNGPEKRNSNSPFFSLV
jgi:hypothetical protein